VHLNINELLSDMNNYKQAFLSHFSSLYNFQ